MITIRVDLYGIEETITRPISIILVDGIKKLLGITDYVFTQYDEKDKLVKRKNRLGELVGNNTITADAILIEEEEESEDTKETSLIPMRPDFPPVYEDKDVQASIIPIYHSRQLSIRFKYCTKSKSKAYALTNKLRLLTANEGYYRRHKLEYHFILPNYVTNLLSHIHTLKYNKIEEKVDFNTYLNMTMDERSDFSHTLDGDGNKSKLVVREAQLDVPGYIVDDIYNIKPEYEEDTTYYTFEFTYGMIYEKPVTMLVNYPILIYNQLIDHSYRHFIEDGWRERDSNSNKPRTGRSKDAMELFEQDDVFALRNNNYYLTLPEFDTFSIPKPEKYFSRMFSVLNIIDDNDPTLLFNLNDIPKIKFKESILKYIILEDRKYVGEKLQSMFYIELYKNEKKDYKNKLILSDTGELRTSEPMDFRYTYRVVFNVVNDLNLLHPSAKGRLKSFIQDEVNRDKSSRPSNFRQSYYYNQDYYNSGKFNYELSSENLVTYYLSLLQINSTEIANVLNSVKNFYEIPFKITDDTGVFRRKTIATASIIALNKIMEKK